jgi:hypothetical protein
MQGIVVGNRAPAFLVPSGTRINVPGNRLKEAIYPGEP